MSERAGLRAGRQPWVHPGRLGAGPQEHGGERRPPCSALSTLSTRVAKAVVAKAACCDRPSTASVPQRTKLSDELAPDACR
jgi:hypothetical protein